MADYGTMRTRIADELHRTDLSDQIALAIQDAILHYQDERFWFNEDRTTTFSTVDGQEFYTSADDSNIPLLAEIDTARITIDSNWNYPLTEDTYDTIDALQNNDNYKGHPTHFCRYDNSLRLYPTPNGVYTIRLSGTLNEATLSASTDTNPWMVEGERLIRAHAKWVLFTDQLRDPNQAATMAGVESRVYSEYVTKTASRTATGRIKGTRF